MSIRNDVRKTIFDKLSSDYVSKTINGRQFLKNNSAKPIPDDNMKYTKYSVEFSNIFSALHYLGLVDETDIKEKCKGYFITNEAIDFIKKCPNSETLGKITSFITEKLKYSEIISIANTQDNPDLIIRIIEGRLVSDINYHLTDKAKDRMSTKIKNAKAKKREKKDNVKIKEKDTVNTDLNTVFINGQNVQGDKETINLALTLFLQHVLPRTNS